MSSEEFGRLLISLFELYLPNISKIKIGTLDIMAQNVSNKKSDLCIFTKCLGKYLALDAKGDLYNCNRFVGNQDFCIGNISTVNSYYELTQKEAWKRIEAWQEWIGEHCIDCLHQPYCHGGCPSICSICFREGSICKGPQLRSL